MRPEDETPRDVPLNRDDLRLELDLLRRFLDEEDLVLGRDGWMTCRHVAALSRGWRVDWRAAGPVG